jgi:hypothetical protein
MTGSAQASNLEEWLHSPLSTPFYSPHVEELPRLDLAIISFGNEDGGCEMLRVRLYLKMGQRYTLEERNHTHNLTSYLSDQERMRYSTTARSALACTCSKQ